ncbi:hypothetical protein MRX96_035417 [Rhipicephalus microplus]
MRVALTAPEKLSGLSVNAFPRGHDMYETKYRHLFETCQQGVECYTPLSWGKYYVRQMCLCLKHDSVERRKNFSVVACSDLAIQCRVVGCCPHFEDRTVFTRHGG